MIVSTPISNMSDKTKQQLKNSLLSYQNRAAYRTTPFGLFSGCEIKDIAEVLGHMRVETTENYYIISAEDNLKKVSESFEKEIDTKIISKYL